MFTFRKISPVQSFATFLGLATAIGIGKYKYDSIKNRRIIENSLHYKTMLNLITLDPKFYNLVGQNYTIKKIVPVEEDSKHLTYRIVFNGFKGDSKVLVKLTKDSYQQIQEINKKNANYSLLEGKEKIKFMYLAVNLNDVLVPTEDTVNRILRDSQKSKEINESFSNYLSYINNTISSYSDRATNKSIVNKLKASKSYLYDFPVKLIPNYNTITEKSNNSILEITNNNLNDKINPLNYNEKDTFWRVNSILMTTNDTFVNSIRPKAGLTRIYENEDTYSYSNNIIDTLKQIELLHLDNIAKIAEVEILSSIKSELITRKSIILNDQRDRRKKIMVFNSIMYLGLFTLYAYFNNKRFTIKKFEKLKEILSSNIDLSRRIGKDYHFSHYNYFFNPVNSNYNLKVCLNNTNNTESTIDGTVEFNNISSAYILSDIKVIMKEDIDKTSSEKSEYSIKQAFLVDNFEKPVKNHDPNPSIFKQSFIYSYDSKNNVFKALTAA